MAANVQRVRHLHLVVADLARSVRFYEQAFGFRPTYTSAAGVVFLRSEAGDSLALSHATADHPAGLGHVGFAVSDPDAIDEVVSQVVAAGGRLLELGELMPGHRHAMVADPDGHVIRV
jgi:catechol 2,3-dioxygenase-like lactoylglutathione lyase family enzyme